MRRVERCTHEAANQRLELDITRSLRQGNLLDMVCQSERRIGLSLKAANYSEEDIKREAAAFDSLKPGEDMVGLEQAFAAAAEEYRPGDSKRK